MQSTSSINPGVVGPHTFQTFTGLYLRWRPLKHFNSGLHAPRTTICGPKRICIRSGQEQENQATTVFDAFMASVVSDFTLQQVLNRDAIIALLTKIGPAILLTHSQAGAFGWPVADARPDLVKAIVAVEPSGPPFFDVQDIGAPEWFRYGTTLARPWGITADPLVYSPPAESASDLQIVQQERPDSPELCKCWLQKSPARQLPNLKRIPILIVTSEASYHAPYDHCTVNFLEQAGIHPTWIKLAQIGIHGNGHNMMLEKNNVEIASALSQWLAKTVPDKGDQHKTSAVAPD